MPLQRRLTLSLILGFISTSGLTASFKSSGPDSEAALPVLEFSRFRFHRDPVSGHERLVLEFRGSRALVSEPFIQFSEKEFFTEARIFLNRVSLKGTIPRRSINKIASLESHFFGPVTFKTDVPAELAMRFEIKESIGSLETFWLEYPQRLVIDIAPRVSKYESKAPRVAKMPVRRRAVAKRETAGGKNKGVPESVIQPVIPTENQIRETNPFVF